MPTVKHATIAQSWPIAFTLMAPVLLAAPGQADDAVPSAPQTQAEGFYGTLAVGALWPQSRKASDPDATPDYSFTDSFREGVSTELGVGYDFGAVRAELTYAYDQAWLRSYRDSSGSYGYTGGQQGTNSLLVSGYWDISTKSRWTPYLGGGIGYGWQNQGNSGDELGNRYTGYRVGAFAWQAKAGVSYSLNRSGDIYAEFVYRGLGGFSASDGPTTYNYSSFNRMGVQVGTRWRF